MPSVWLAAHCLDIIIDEALALPQRQHRIYHIFGWSWHQKKKIAHLCVWVILGPPISTHMQMKNMMKPSLKWWIAQKSTIDNPNCGGVLRFHMTPPSCGKWIKTSMRSVKWALVKIQDSRVLTHLRCSNSHPIEPRLRTRPQLQLQLFSKEILASFRLTSYSLQSSLPPWLLLS